MRRSRNFLWGIVFIIIGLIWGLNALGITRIDITLIDGWWTLFIIVPCFVGLFNEKEKKGNLIGLAVGVILFLSCQNILDFDLVWKLAVPVIFVLLGLSFIFKDTLHKNVSKEIERLNQQGARENEYCATFSGQNIDFNGEEFQGATLTAVFGGVKCDLRNAVIRQDQVVNCTAIFGGITVYTPNDMKVKIKSTSIFGGVSNKKEYVPLEDANTIYVNASCVFGGVDVK